MSGSIRRVVLSCADLEGLSRFYAALGFVAGAPTEVDAVRYGVAGRALSVRLSLGTQRIELLRFAEPGAPIAADATSHDADFQHFALVTSDMHAAFTALSAEPGWTPISRGGAPVRLPPSSGGATAFKFRDPEGHPLELLAFAEPPAAWRGHGAGTLLGIDHSAIVVGDVDASLAFYARLGLARHGGSLNEGDEQDRLDGVEGAVVEVSALSRDADVAPMHLELLGYRTPAVRAVRHGETDIAATRLVLDDETERLIQVTDPDGHRLLVAQAPGLR